MDSKQFDALSRSLAAAGTRRGILRLLGALPLVGVLLTSVDDGLAGARHHRKPQRHGAKQRARAHAQKKHSKKKPCPPCKKRMRGKCTQRMPDGTACAGGTCQGGRCQPGSSPAPPGCTPTTCAAQGKNCGAIPDGCGNQLQCGPDLCGEGYTCTENRCLCPDGTAVCQGVCCDQGEVCQNGDGPCCTAQGKDAACAGRACGPATDSCTGEVYACGNPCPTCFTCVDGACEDTGGIVCGEDCCTGTGQTCGGGGTPGVCGCTPTTCFDIETMCSISGDCDYGICGTIADGCGGTLDCGTCAGGHPCFSCEDNICVRFPGSAVCGTACCFSGCCVTPGTGLCGAETCVTGQCCPIGYTCCNGTVNGSPKSTCYNIDTYCQGRGVVCCGTGNTCCPDEPCCTSDAQCTGGKHCRFTGSGVSGAGCCSFTP